MNDDKRLLISFDEAVKLLPAGKYVHTFRNPAGMLIGADHGREELLADMKAAPEIQVAGPSAQSMKHGLCIWDERGPLFIETVRQE